MYLYLYLFFTTIKVFVLSAAVHTFIFREAESVVLGSSTGESALPTLERPSKMPTDKDLSEESSDESDPTGFSFALAQPYAQAVKQAIGRKRPRSHLKKLIYFPFFKETFVPFPSHE